MKNHYAILLFIMTFACYPSSTFPHSAAGKLLLIDTAGNPAYSYRTIIELFQDQGFTIDFTHFYNIKKINAETYSGALLLCSPSFIANQTHPLVENTITQLALLAYQKNKLIGIFLPQHVAPSYHEFFFFKTLLFDILQAGSPSNKDALEFFCDEYLPHALEHDAMIKCNYDTTLAPKRNLRYVVPYHPRSQFDPHTKRIIGATLPFHPPSLPNDHQTILPVGLLLSNENLHNTYFIAKRCFFSYADPLENFWLTPFSKDLKESLLAVDAQVIHEIKNYYTTDTIPIQKKTFHSPFMLSHSFSLKQKILQDQERGKNIAPEYAWILKEKMATGWMDIETYSGCEHQAAQNIFDAHLNVLWFTFNPEWYLSFRAQKNDTDKKRWFETIKKFTYQLKATYDNSKQPLPHIFVGIDLTNNFGNAPVYEATTDIYGKRYSKIPTPLDYKHFWKEECIKPLKLFVKEWNQSLGNGIPLHGIFLDLEMYHAQNQAGNYVNTMDFSETAWNSFLNEMPMHPCKTASLSERTSCLYDQHLFDSYFLSLKHSAHSLGEHLYRHFQKIIPDCLIGIYNLGLPVEWFYQGLLAGLSKPERPLILATFNTDFYPHASWLAQEGIYAFHHPPLLLSHFQQENDFYRIKDYSQENDGIWFNRFSWLVKPYQFNQWYEKESTPLPTSVVTKNIAQQFEQIRRA